MDIDSFRDSVVTVIVESTRKEVSRLLLSKGASTPRLESPGRGPRNPSLNSPTVFSFQPAIHFVPVTGLACINILPPTVVTNHEGQINHWVVVDVHPDQEDFDRFAGLNPIRKDASLMPRVRVDMPALETSKAF